MGSLSDHAANACIYCGYAAVLLIGLAACWFGAGKGEFLSGNGTRRALPLTMNFVASGLGVGILSTFPQIGAQSGLHGLFVYAAACAVPMVMFGFLGPVIRKQLPEAFVLTEWIRWRYGTVASLIVSCCTIVTIFLSMVSELASLKACVETLTDVPGLPVLIVEAVVVSIYTSLGGFYVSFLTDNLQGAAFGVLFVVCIIATGCTVKIDPSLVGPSHLLKANKLGWKLVYILTVALVTNDCFVAGFWLRTFSARTNKDLYIAVILSGFLIFCILSVLGIPGLLAVWARLLDPNSPDFENESQNAFYLLMRSLPSWVSGFVLVFCTMVSSAMFDSLQSAMVTTISNDFCRNRVRIWWVRIIVIAILVPCIVVSLRASNVLDIYLIVDVLSAAIVPVLFLGLVNWFFFVTGFEVTCSIIGGILGVFIFGTIYYHSASQGGSLLLMEQGLYGDDWGAFGAFVAAPVCCVIGAIVGLVLRGIFLAIKHKQLWYVFKKPEAPLTFTPTPDHILFVLSKPWYTYLRLGSFGEWLDRLIFVQDDEDAAKLHDGAIFGHHTEHSDPEHDSASDTRPEKNNGIIATVTTKYNPFVSHRNA